MTLYSTSGAAPVPWVDVLLELRTRRSEDRIQPRNIDFLISRVSTSPTVVQVSRDEQCGVAEALILVLAQTIKQVPGLEEHSVSESLAQEILREVLMEAGLRRDARKRLVDRHRDHPNITLHRLRKPGGIEEKVIEILARILTQDDAESLPSRQVQHSELYFGLVKWLGTDDEETIRTLRATLYGAGFQVCIIKVSKLITSIVDASFSVNEPSEDLVGYLQERMDAGDQARQVDPGVLAELIIQEIAKERERFRGDRNRAKYRGIAYIIDSLMHPAEVDLLRRTYGSLFFLIALYQGEDSRRARMLGGPGAAASQNLRPDDNLEAAVDHLLLRNRGRVQRSMSDVPKSHVLSIERVFHLADVFVDAVDTGQSRKTTKGTEGLSQFTIERFLEQIFSNPHNTPTRHELGMAHAFVESRRSGAITRSVGAAICTSDGELVAVGTNEVPAPGGGQYPTRSLDVRDRHFLKWLADNKLKSERSIDPNDDFKLEMLRDLLIGMLRMGIIPRDQEGLFESPMRDFPAEADLLIEQTPSLRESRIFDVIEYTRVVHAEMDAVMSSMRRGVSVQGCVIYSTTFPCHECARHLITAGLSRVIYIEPYPKSRVGGLHPDSATLQRRREDVPDERVEFLPFIGISPSRQAVLYSHLSRKHVTKDGRSELRQWDLKSAPLRRTVESPDPQQRTLEAAARDAKEQATIELLERRRGRRVDSRTGVR